jgi:excisionase family DNA binding protein
MEIMHTGAYKEFLTTEEAAAYLRLSERKLYELVANSSIPCTKATGRWLSRERPSIAGSWPALSHPRR